MDPLTTAAGAAAAAAGAAIVKSDAAKAAVEATRAAVSEVWTALLRPAATEVGLELRSRVAEWRLRNAARVADRVKARLADAGDVSVHPRLGIVLLEQSSLAEDELLQDMWAGLVAASAASGEGDDGNLMFTDLLSRLTASEARLLEWVCRHTKPSLIAPGIVMSAESLWLPVAGVREVTGVQDAYRLDREMDHLRTLGLIEGGFHGSALAEASANPPPAQLQATSLGLQMFALCNGSRDLLAFYGLTPPPAEQAGTHGGPPAQ
jgi:hypothetical protein